MLFASSCIVLRFYLFIYLFEKKETGWAGGAEGERESQVDSTQSPTWGPIPGPRDHDLSRNQELGT